MFKSLQQFPARTNRNSSIEEAMRSFERESILKSCWVAGRIVGLIEEGFVLQDASSRIEIINSKSEIINFDVGDIAEVLLDGEWETVNGKRMPVYSAKNLQVLVKCASDFYIRKEDPNYLKSVIDLRLKDFLEQRGKVLKAVRDWFWSKGFLEVETPIAVRLPGMEPHLDVLKTQFTGLALEGQKPQSEDLYLITSPEYAMKKLLVAGHEKIFQITKCFRNKEHESTLHNPEFTMLEWYRAYASYEDWIRDAEEMVTSLAKMFNVTLAEGWEKVKVKDLFQKYAGIAHEDFEDVEKFRKAVSSIGYRVAAETSYEDMFFMVFLNEIEPKLGIEKPTIVYEYPSQMAALAKKCEHDPRYAERAEIYINGMELANGFTELNDPIEQAERLEAERAERQKLKKDDYPVDQSFIRALEFGMPPSGGVALGVDRLVMLLTGAVDIRDILAFPHRDL